MIKPSPAHHRTSDSIKLIPKTCKLKHLNTWTNYKKRSCFNVWRKVEVQTRIIASKQIARCCIYRTHVSQRTRPTFHHLNNSTQCRLTHFSNSSVTTDKASCNHCKSSDHIENVSVPFPAKYHQHTFLWHICIACSTKQKQRWTNAGACSAALKINSRFCRIRIQTSVYFTYTKGESGQHWPIGEEASCSWETFPCRSADARHRTCYQRRHLRRASSSLCCLAGMRPLELWASS